MISRRKLVSRMAIGLLSAGIIKCGSTLITPLDYTPSLQRPSLSQYEPEHIREFLDEVRYVP